MTTEPQAIPIVNILFCEGAPGPSARVMACRIVLELAQRGEETEELIFRVEALERTAESKNHRITPIRAAR